jgi:hypothetical protein
LVDDEFNVMADSGSPPEKNPDPKLGQIKMVFARETTTNPEISINRR